MFSQTINNSFYKSFIFKCLIALFLLFCFAVAAARAQTTDASQAASLQTKTEAVKTAPAPLVRDYKGVTIGMPEDEVKDKLGKPELNDNTGFFYIFSDEERAQISFDAEKKVNMIAVFYSPDNKNTPKYADVFGQDSIAPTKDDGSIYNLVNYPQVGYWVAYSRLAGDDALVTVTMQKMRTAQ